MNETLLISTNLLCDAFACLAPVKTDTDYLRRWPNNTTHVTVAFVKALRTEIASGYDGCDHSVGICQCLTSAVLNELTLWLDGKHTCPDCHGDGWDWEAETKCGTCNGAAFVALDPATNRPETSR